MPPDFYFRGTLSQYWKVVYAEYLRLTAMLDREPFAITASELKLPLAEYTPTIFDNVIIQFRDEERRNCIVSVKADTVLGAELVNLYVDIYVEPLKKSGASAYARWVEIQNAWLENGLLINPAAQIAELAQIGSKPDKPIKPDLDSDLNLWFDYYHNMHAAQFNYTFKDLSRDSGHTAGHLANMHGNYKKERGLT